MTENKEILDVTDKDSHASSQTLPKGPYDIGSKVEVAPTLDQSLGNGEDIEKAEPGSKKQIPYSVFSNNQKRFIVFMVSLAGFISPLSSSIYFPALNSIAETYDKSDSMVNLTITSYMIFQALAPTIVGGLSEALGRRPMYVAAFVVYMGANIGLALQNSYTSLLVLRCLQSAGSSGTISLALGVVADISTSSERGTYIGFAVSGFMIAPAIGPIIGGILAEFLGWRAIFWFLVIISGLVLAAVVVTFPETNRTLVGNGSIKPTGLNMSLTDFFRFRKQSAQNAVESESEVGSTGVAKKLPWWQALFGPFTVLKELDVVIAVVQNAIALSCFLVITATLPSIYQKNYGFNDLQIGLCYVPLGVSSCSASIVTGKLVDFNYRRTAKKLGFIIDPNKSDNFPNFPLEKCRLQIVWIPTATGVALTMGYGWALDRNAPLAVPLVLIFILGLSLTASVNVMSTITVDLCPDQSATVTAANNLVRCLLAAGAIAGIAPLIGAIGVGPSFTLVGGILLLSTPLLLLLPKSGAEGRNKRQIKKTSQDEKQRTRS